MYDGFTKSGVFENLLPAGGGSFTAKGRRVYGKFPNFV